MSEFVTPYPPIQPYRTQFLEVGDAQRLYVEESGNPAGKPAVFLHGGPGGGTTPDQRRFFDPARYRIVLFDQRGCGRSTPSAAAVGADLSTNTTPALVADLEAIRVALGIERWLVFGGSWGSALALAYAEAHPGRVTELVLRGIFTLRRFELDWYYNGPAGIMAPQAWADFCVPLLRAGITPVSRLDQVGAGRDNIAAYHRLLWDDDPAVVTAAAVAWTCWETATSYLHRDPAKVAASAADVAGAIAFARIENHYFVHGGFFAEGELIAGVDRIRHLPGVIVQGEYDLCCPARTAWDLAQEWPEAQFHLTHAGHAAFEPENTRALVAATDRFAAL